jgi:trigger factor
MTLEMLGMNDENFNKTYRDMALQQVKGELLLDSIAELEKISADDTEVEAKIKTIAEEANTPLENVQKYFENSQARDGLRGQIISDKVIAVLLEKSIVTEVEPKPQGQDDVVEEES